MRLLIALIALSLTVAPGAAQQGPEIPVPTGWLVVAGAAGGAVGWVGGALALGYPLGIWNPFNSDELDDEVWTPGIVIGFETGQSIGIPLAVHLANRRRGSFRASLFASLGLGAVGTALLWTGNFDAVFDQRSRQAVLIAIPVAQLISSVVIERATTR